MRLIDADALKKALKSNCDLCNDKNTNWCENCCPHNDFEDLIDNAPTVYPKQGKWIYHRAVDYFLPCMECNNCHEEFLLNDLTPAYFKKVKRYCTNCGAEMGGGAYD